MRRWLVSIILASRRRRRYQSMLELDDRLLADAGTTRAELARLAAGHRTVKILY